MADEKRTRVWVQTKHGRKIWRFGVHVGPDRAEPMDVTAAQLADLRAQSVEIAKGGVFNLFTTDPTPKPEPAPAGRPGSPTGAAGGNGGAR